MVIVSARSREAAVSLLPPSAGAAQGVMRRRSGLFSPDGTVSEKQGELYLSQGQMSILFRFNLIENFVSRARKISNFFTSACREPEKFFPALLDCRKGPSDFSDKGDAGRRAHSLREAQFAHLRPEKYFPRHTCCRRK